MHPSGPLLLGKPLPVETPKWRKLNLKSLVDYHGIEEFQIQDKPDFARGFYSKMSRTMRQLDPQELEIPHSEWQTLKLKPWLGFEEQSLWEGDPIKLSCNCIAGAEYRYLW